MPSLAHVLAQHGPALILDAASGAVQVGVLAAAERPIWARPPGDAGTALFTGAEGALAESGLTLRDIRSFIFCEGPGSMLGIRTAAMAIRTWRAIEPHPAFAYQSLAVAAHATWSSAAPRPFALLADARRDSWHVQAIDADGRLAPLARLPTSALPAGELLMPANFRTWSTPPRAPAPCAYDVAAIFAVLGDGDFFRAVEAPDAYQSEAPDYRRWSATVHSAATAPRR